MVLTIKPSCDRSALARIPSVRRIIMQSLWWRHYQDTKTGFLPRFSKNRLKNQADF